MLRIRKYLAKTIYWYVSTFGESSITLMNYGYVDERMDIRLTPAEETNRAAIQLYHHISSSVDMHGKDVIEIGCGRGGGLSYLVRTFQPSQAVGVDLCRKAVAFCHLNHNPHGLSFVQANAECLPFVDESFDVAINVESSHRYENFEKFLAEVHRVLRPGGVFLLADYRNRKKMGSLRNLLNSPFKILQEEFINSQIVASLQGDWENKFSYYKNILPGIMHCVLKGFSHKIRERLVNKFTTHKKIYFCYSLQKRQSIEQIHRLAAIA